MKLWYEYPWKQELKYAQSKNIWNTKLKEAKNNCWKSTGTSLFKRSMSKSLFGKFFVWAFPEEKNKKKKRKKIFYKFKFIKQFLETLWYNFSKFLF